MRAPIVTLLAALLALPAARTPDGGAGSIAPHPVLVDGDIRPGLDLSGPWHYSIDPYRDGVAGFHGGDPGEGHRRWEDRDPEAVAAADPNALFEYDMRRSPIAQLPSSWLTEDPTLRYYNGLVWYKRAFQAAPKRGERAFLRFGAVNYDADIWLNGTFVGRHEGGFTPFAFEVTSLLKPGENRVTVGADSTRTDESVPPPVTDWETYGGITRPVRLVSVPSTYVDDAWTRLTADGRIEAEMQLDGTGAGGQAVSLAVPALGLTIAGRTDAHGHWAGSAPAPAALARWSPDAPTLYAVRFAAGSDHLDDRVGYRTLAVRNGEILLNGKPIYLRGVAIHEEEFGANPTRAITPAAARALLSEAKEGLHANFVRLAHYPHNELMTRTADELGLIVWSEIPVYWRVDWKNAGTLAEAKRMLAEEILRDRDRASVAFWSIGNETPVSPERTAFLSALADEAHAIDPSRLVTAALLAKREEKGGDVTVTLDDPMAAHLDVLAINTYNGWYTNDPLPSLPQTEWRSPYGKPVVFSEFGAGALAGFHDPAHHRKFSEEFQADYYRWTLAMTDRIPFLRGTTAWVLKDFRSPRRQNPIYQQGWNRKGLESETGVRKAAFDVLAEHYAAREAAAR